MNDVKTSKYQSAIVDHLIYFPLFDGLKGNELNVVAESMNVFEVGQSEILFKVGVDHRAALVLRGPGLSNEVIGNDPKVENKKPEHIIPKTIAAEKTARVLKKFIGQSSGIMSALELNRDRIANNELPANFLLIRGAGRAPNIDSFQTKFGISAECIAGGGLYKGVASICGMKISLAWRAFNFSTT